MQREIVVSGQEDFLWSSGLFRTEINETLGQCPGLIEAEDYWQAMVDVKDALMLFNTVSIEVDKETGLQISGLKERNKRVSVHAPRSESIDNAKIFETRESPKRSKAQTGTAGLRLRR